MGSPSAGGLPSILGLSIPSAKLGDVTSREYQHCTGTGTGRVPVPVLSVKRGDKGPGRPSNKGWWFDHARYAEAQAFRSTTFSRPAPKSS